MKQPKPTKKTGNDYLKKITYPTAKPLKSTRFTSPEEKVKIAKQLYRDNPGKVYRDAVKRAEAEVIAKKKK